MQVTEIEDAEVQRKAETNIQHRNTGLPGQTNCHEPTAPGAAATGEPVSKVIVVAGGGIGYAFMIPAKVICVDCSPFVGGACS